MDGLNGNGILVDGSFVIVAGKPEEAQLIELLLKHFADRFTAECTKDKSGEKGMAEKCSAILTKNSIAHSVITVTPITLMGTSKQGSSIEDQL